MTEQVVGKLLDDFERGKMTRRQLIQALALSATATVATGEAAAVPAERKGFRAVTVNHISYQAGDYTKTRDFYAELLGMKVVRDTGSQCFLVLGEGNSFLIPRNAPAGVTAPRIDHVAYTIADWDKNAVETELKRRGLDPRPDTDNSFHVSDPNGFDLQISGAGMTPYST